RNMQQGASNSPEHKSPRSLNPLPLTTSGSTIDPVCGMTVDPEHAAGSTDYEDKTYYFCNLGCLKKFQADPERYLKPKSTIHRLTTSSPHNTTSDHSSFPSQQTEYTCPMHPEVVQDRPGSCPKCGMALEPRTIMPEEGPNPELVDMSRRFWIGLAPSL